MKYDFELFNQQRTRTSSTLMLRTHRTSLQFELRVLDLGLT